MSDVGVRIVSWQGKVRSVDNRVAMLLSRRHDIKPEEQMRGRFEFEDMSVGSEVFDHLRTEAESKGTTESDTRYNTACVVARHHKGHEGSMRAVIWVGLDLLLRTESWHRVQRDDGVETLIVIRLHELSICTNGLVDVLTEMLP